MHDIAMILRNEHGYNRERVWKRKAWAYAGAETTPNRFHPEPGTHKTPELGTPHSCCRAISQTRWLSSGSTSAVIASFTAFVEPGMAM